MNSTLHTLEKSYFYFIEYSRKDLKVVGKDGYWKINQCSRYTLSIPPEKEKRF